METLLFLLLAFALFFLLITSFITIHNLFYFKGLDFNLDEEKRASSSDSLNAAPSPHLSLLIPARNEESNLPRLFDSLAQQTFKNIELIILDDQSIDKTRHIAESFAKNAPFPVKVFTGKNKPDHWLGKNWACHQLSHLAQGDILLFLDADTWLAPSCLENIISAMGKYGLDFATVWPHQIMETKTEKTVISTVYSTIVTYLPTYYSYEAPFWIPFKSLREKCKPLFASACGQCMIFKKEAYFDIDGHRSVKNEVVEDVMLSKKIVSQGKKMRMFHGTNTLWCRMYQTKMEIFQGFRKNFFAGFGYQWVPFFLAWALHIIVYLIPPLLLAIFFLDFVKAEQKELLIGLAACAAAIPLVQRFTVSRFLNWPDSIPIYLLPGILWFQMLAIVVVRDRILNIRAVWKGRPV